MGLSTNVVWHQTTFKGLEAIIQSKKLKCSYSLETIKWKGSTKNIAFPMISFCDIPLSDIGEYLGKYGPYTIGFKSKWAKSKGLSLVWYRYVEALSLRNQMDSFKNLGGKCKEWTESEKSLWYSIAYTKNYDGELKKYGFSSYRFYDERELRYVPDFNSLVGQNEKPFISEEDYQGLKKSKGSTFVEGFDLGFDVNDIEYVLISERNQFKNVKGLFDRDVSHITFLSHRQIEQDIIGQSHNRKK
ncbi:abortive infection system antitoxin AbiGi family protein [Bacteroides sp. AN502(2024)]|uniref:abortive infection system antitoxin AbiGi family protein n=1 Tax=Bacteroides sp. AN502(2024) TaxID=3160599 RepID=UPI00351752F3